MTEGTGINDFRRTMNQVDLIQMFKIVRGHEKIRLVNGVMRLVREISKRCSQRYNFIKNRVASKWNELPHSIFYVVSLNCFKSRIDRGIFGMIKRNNENTVTTQVELNTSWR